MPTSPPQSPKLDPGNVSLSFWKQPDAFNQLYNQLGPFLMYYLRSHCRNTHLAEEISQNTWTNAWNRRMTFRGGNFRAWIFQIAKNEFANSYRQKRYPGQIPEGLDVVQAVREERTEMLNALKDCLQTVGNHFADVLKAQLEGFSTEDIAKQLGIEPGTVGSRALRGKGKLKECIEGKLK